MSPNSTAHRPDGLNISALTAYLWDAANILRGPVDAADFKTYIFPLLFFKRLSDVYDEEYAVALEESDGDLEYAQFPENHRFQVPEGSHCYRTLSRRTLDRAPQSSGTTATAA